ncbi:hypothetical protein ALC60_04908 [Trachymyrmex zeteki]|uniref:Uncharacterized protein n=1 Tax=Mycetomoellerius zeteki TaxID=64791 RepID=A0A151X762_9HYME|nr:hypothetical protein ALC60_04908 [Trachymyrmex zeteki]
MRTRTSTAFVMISLRLVENDATNRVIGETPYVVNECIVSVEMIVVSFVLRRGKRVAGRQAGRQADRQAGGKQASKQAGKAGRQVDSIDISVKRQLLYRYKKLQRVALVLCIRWKVAALLTSIKYTAQSINQQHYNVQAVTHCKRYSNIVASVLYVISGRENAYHVNSYLLRRFYIPTSIENQNSFSIHRFYTILHFLDLQYLVGIRVRENPAISNLIIPLSPCICSYK